MADSRDITHLVVPGTYDPLTLGHLDVIKRARRLAPEVTVAVAHSRRKNGVGTTFSLEERVEMVKEAIVEADLPAGIEVAPFSGLLVDFCHEIGAGGVVKGLRAMTDFEYELQQASLNQRMAPDIESIFVMAQPEYGYLSSSIVRELGSFGADVSMLVPACVARRLSGRFA